MILSIKVPHSKIIKFYVVHFYNFNTLFDNKTRWNSITHKIKIIAKGDIHMKKYIETIKII
ncbi:Uncharacterised protein [Scardovia inopinata]|uniref:Uncharacterized protein n=1 Tax=Scardovia inopinata F0304 TaxID=641146 RepID=W1MXI1_SCAIO|nr:hypothetical protein HMPREF9020_01543 [Scardovia inopinata F0304]SUV51414.1 Uncharacterised protein [Scardovia inopinata]